MADRVIIVGVHRAKQEVPMNEIIQMCGRAGRREGELGEVDIFVDDDHEDFTERFKDAKKEEVLSVLNELDSLCFHLISVIDAGVVKTTEQAENWYSRSFACFQGLCNKKLLEKAINHLIEVEAIVKDSILLAPTNFGSIASKLYFHPSDIKAWDENLESLCDLDKLEDDKTIAWALGCVSHNKSSVFDIRNMYEAADDFRSHLEGQGLMEDGILHTCMVWWALLGGPSCKAMSSDLERFKQDCHRVLTAWKMIVHNHMDKPELIELVDNLFIRLKKRASLELVPLLKIKGLSKSSALELYNSVGASDEDELREKIDVIEAMGSDGLKANLRQLGFIHD